MAEGVSIVFSKHSNFRRPVEADFYRPCVFLLLFKFYGVAPRQLPFFQEVAEGVSNIDGLCLVGDPKAMVVCFRGVDGVNIYSVVSVIGPPNRGPGA